MKFRNDRLTFTTIPEKAGKKNAYEDSKHNMHIRPQIDIKAVTVTAEWLQMRNCFTGNEITGD